MQGRGRRAPPPPHRLASPLIFGSFLVVACTNWTWARRWLVSGVPVLSFLVLLGHSRRRRILPIIPVWTLLTTINLAYAIASTSWLLYFTLSMSVYPAIFISAMVQFDSVSRLVRQTLRKVIRQIQFIHDRIAFFDIPALEIDVDVDGLMIIRGLTFSLSTFTIVAHGVEVGIKLSDDIELAISTEKVTIPLFRKVIIGDCYANVKGGEWEMTFGELGDTDKDDDGDAVMIEATPLLLAAGAKGDKSKPKRISMKRQMTDGVDMLDSAASAGLKGMKTLSPEDALARKQYDEMLRWISESNMIELCRKDVDMAGKLDSQEDRRAAICSRMQNKPTVPHPPKRSIRVTTLQNLTHRRARGLLHRMPMLLRLLLNPIAYFHPVYISSITAGGSGRWISYLLKTHLFKEYSADNRELRKLERRVLSWLTDANFILQLVDIRGLASVPFISSFDIKADLNISDVIAYRTPTDGVDSEEVLRLGGGDASFIVPSFLLPHHEHLLPAKSTKMDKIHMADEIAEADGKPNKLQAEHKLEQAEADEANVRISAHAQLPACFSQDLLNFTAALVKATKVVELEKEPGLMDAKITNVKGLSSAISKGIKDGVKKTVVDGIVSDQWIAKMVGKVTKALESAQGDVGYSGDIPVKLEKYRLPDGHPEASKILP